MLSVKLIVSEAERVPHDVHGVLDGDVLCIDSHSHLKVQCYIATLSIRVVHEEDRARDILQAVGKVSHLPRPPYTIQVRMVQKEDGVGRTCVQIAHLAECSTNAVVATTVNTRGIEARTTLHNSVEVAVVWLVQSEFGLVHTEIAVGKGRAEITLQAAWVSREIALRAQIHNHVLERAILDTAATGATRYVHSGVAAVAWDIRPIASKAKYWVEHWRFAKFADRSHIQRPVPVWLSTPIATLIAQALLVESGEPAVPGKEVTLENVSECTARLLCSTYRVVNVEGLMNVRGNQIIVSAHRSGRISLGGDARLGQEALDG